MLQSKLGGMQRIDSIVRFSNYKRQMLNIEYVRIKKYFIFQFRIILNLENIF